METGKTGEDEAMTRAEQDRIDTETCRRIYELSIRLWKEQRIHLNVHWVMVEGMSYISQAVQGEGGSECGKDIIEEIEQL